MKGLGLAGAFRELYDRGYRAQCAAGTSAGAITAALVAAGYTGEELESVVLNEMDFRLFADRPRLHALGPLGEVIDVLKHRGLHRGDYFLRWIREKLETRGIGTFANLSSSDPATVGTRLRGLERNQDAAIPASRTPRSRLLASLDDAEIPAYASISGSPSRCQRRMVLPKEGSSMWPNPDDWSLPPEDIPGRGETIGFAARTIRNLEYVVTAHACREPVHVVTQVVLSLLGLVVFPFEHLGKDVESSLGYDLSIEQLEAKGWPGWEQAEGSRHATTLAHLIRNLRHATAHGNIEFSTNSRFLEEVRVTFINAPPNRPWRWEASIGADDLLKFCRRYATLIGSSPWLHKRDDVT